MLIFAGLLLTAGAIGDRFGRRNALLAGLAVFAIGAAIGGIGTTAAQVIAGRTVMGIGAAFIMPATLSLATSVFPPQERRKAIAIWAGFAGAGGAIGPLLSGGLLEVFWWGSALIVNIPIVLALMAAIAVYAPRSRDPHFTPLDLVGAGLSLVGVTALVYGIIEGPSIGWNSGPVVAAFVIASVTIGAFLWWERRALHPMLPIDLFGDARFRIGSAVITTAFFVMFGFFFLNTLYLQFVRDYSPLLAGAATLPLAAMLVLVSPRSSEAADRFGSGQVIATGFALIAVGFAVLAQVDAATPFPVLMAAYLLLGGGMGITAAPATGSIMSAVPVAKAGVGSAVNDTTRELGGALGIAVLDSIANAAYTQRLDLDGLGLSADVELTAAESVGAVTMIAERLGPAGTELAARADAAFSDAFNLAAWTTAALAATAAAVVWTRFRPEHERTAAAGQSDPVPAGASA